MDYNDKMKYMYNNRQYINQFFKSQTNNQKDLPALVSDFHQINFDKFDKNTLSALKDKLNQLQIKQNAIEK